MSTHDCATFQDRLTTALTDDGALSTETLAVGRQCATCAAVLRDVVRATAPDDAIEPSPQVADRAIAGGQSWARRAWAIAKLVNVTVSVGLVVMWILVVELAFGLRLPSLGNAARAMVVISTVSVLGYLALRGHVRAGEREVLYARWPGRQLQGLCVGIAEYFRVPTLLVRTVFVVLFVTGLGGGTIYFLLSFLVGFHPDDRQYLRWFRIQRWWRRRVHPEASRSNGSA